MQRYYLAIGTITLSGFGLWLALTITDSPEHAKDALVDTISTTTPNSLITSECQEYYENIFPNAPEYGTFAEYNTSTSTTAPTTTEVDTESHSVAKRFYTHHETALDNQSRQFAGAYRISSWSFTGIGTMLAAVDTRDGSVHPFPYIIDWDFDFRPNSNLLINNPKAATEAGPPEFAPLGARTTKST
jgi:hypothetical protein